MNKFFILKITNSQVRSLWKFNFQTMNLPSYILLMFIFLFPFRVFSESYIGVLGGRNGGQHIFETGNKYPNLSGIRGGSRITYDRNYNFGGIEGGYSKGRFNIEGKFATTGWTVNTKGGRDEDFFLGQVSTERNSKLSISPLYLHDTAHTYTGTQNFADGKGSLSIYEQRISFFGKYFFSGESASPWEKKDRFYLTFGFRYNYFKYLLYDVNQFIQRPIYYGPIGVGLSYSYSGVEYGGGGGYIYQFGNFRIEPSFILLIGYNRFRDFHFQRNLNFIGENSGLGFISKIQTSYDVSENTQLRLSYEAHRMFTTGYFKTKGGLSSGDVLSGYSGKYSGGSSTKEAYIEFGAITKLSGLL